jgi:hypothetical protein
MSAIAAVHHPALQTVYEEFLCGGEESHDHQLSPQGAGLQRM